MDAIKVIALSCTILVSLLCSQPVPAQGNQSVCTGGNAVRKSHPGHYVSLNGMDTRADVPAVLVPGVAGIQQRYSWRSLEPAEGEYDFSEIVADLAVVAEHDAQLVVFVLDKSFDEANPVPDYMLDYATDNRVDGHMALRWHPYVVERFKLLMAALGEQVDCHPNLEGVAIQESALSLNDDMLDKYDYSPEAYRDALIEVLLGMASSLPHSQAFWYMNFLPRGQRYLADVAEAVAPAGVAMGGPDILPGRDSLERRTYPLYRRFADQMTLFGSIQYVSYGHAREGAAASDKSKYWTLEELFRYARDDLHVSYVFWNHKTWRNPKDSYDWDDAVPVIRANASFSH
jgi:hypothetical protein